MSIDLEKLPHGPLQFGQSAADVPPVYLLGSHGDLFCRIVSSPHFDAKVFAEFIVKAHAAFGILTLRRWSIFCASDGRWAVTWPEANSLHRFCNATGNSCHDPFTAIVEADAWYKTNVEKAN